MSPDIAWCGPGLLALLVIASPASAQDDQGGALRFLKPWIERQLFGRETSPSPTEIPPTAPEMPPRVDQPAQAPEADLQQAAEPLPDQPAPPAVSEPPADGWAPSGAPFEGGPELRGTDPSTDFSSPQQDGSADAAVAPATEIEERPGVPVEATPETLRFAVLAGRSAAATMAKIGPNGEELQQILGRPVEILPFPSYDTMIEAQVQRRIDGGFFSAAAFAAADSACTCVEPLVAPKALDGTLAYHAIIVARAGSGIASLADLAGKRIALGTADSLGGRRLQLAGLLSEGLDPATTFGAVIAAGSSEEAVKLVAAGAADAAFGWSSLAGGVASGYSRGTLADLVARGEVAMDRLAVIWSSPPVGHGPFAVVRAMPEEDRAKIESYLMSLSARDPDAYDMLDPFYGGGYAPVDLEDYTGLEALLSQKVDELRLPGGPVTAGATTGAPGQPPEGPVTTPAAD